MRLLLCSRLSVSGRLGVRTAHCVPGRNASCGWIWVQVFFVLFLIFIFFTILIFEKFCNCLISSKKACSLTPRVPWRRLSHARVRLLTGADRSPRNFLPLHLGTEKHGTQR